MAEFIKLTPERVEQLARQFGVAPKEILQQWEAAQSQGPDAILSEMDDHLAELESEMDGVVAGISLDRPNRLRRISSMYEDLMDIVGDADEADVPDLLLKLAIAIYKLAEAREEIKQLSNAVPFEGNRRAGPLGT